MMANVTCEVILYQLRPVCLYSLLFSPSISSLSLNANFLFYLSFSHFSPIPASSVNAVTGSFVSSPASYTANVAMSEAISIDICIPIFDPWSLSYQTGLCLVNDARNLLGYNPPATGATNQPCVTGRTS